MHLTEKYALKPLVMELDSEIQSTTPKIEVCFGGVSPLSPNNGLTTCYGIYIPEKGNNPSAGIIIDNGTGIHNVMKFLDKKNPEIVFQLQTHVHNDHINGLLFNKYLFTKDMVTHCLIPEYTLQQMLVQVRPPYHPVEMRPLPTFTDSGIFNGIGICIEPFRLPHGNEMCVGFKITAHGKQIIVATDCELAEDEWQDDFARWSSKADMIIIDMKYSDESLYKKGHGHNSQSLVTSMLNSRYRLANSTPTHIVFVHQDSSHQNKKLVNQMTTSLLKVMYGSMITTSSTPADGDIIAL